MKDTVRFESAVRKINMITSRDEEYSDCIQNKTADDVCSTNTHEKGAQRQEVQETEIEGVKPMDLGLPLRLK